MAQNNWKSCGYHKISPVKDSHFAKCICPWFHHLNGSPPSFFPKTAAKSRKKLQDIFRTMSHLHRLWRGASCWISISTPRPVNCRNVIRLPRPLCSLLVSLLPPSASFIICLIVRAPGERKLCINKKKKKKKKKTPKNTSTEMSLDPDLSVLKAMKWNCISAGEVILENQQQKLESKLPFKFFKHI